MSTQIYKTKEVHVTHDEADKLRLSNLINLALEDKYRLEARKFWFNKLVKNRVKPLEIAIAKANHEYQRGYAINEVKCYLKQDWELRKLIYLSAETNEIIEIEDMPSSMQVTLEFHDDMQEVA